MFVWAGKDVANSESAVNYLVHIACNRLSCESKWNAKLQFCFLKRGKTYCSTCNSYIIQRVS